MNINGYNFMYVCDIQPDSDKVSKRIHRYKPQGRYNNRRGIALNTYGGGEFCRFRIPRSYKCSGVYVVTVNNNPQYVGECKNLTARFNIGYGQISPRNCYVGGQETNCRINSRILDEVLKSHAVALWFMATEDYKNIERNLRQQINWPWNRIRRISNHRLLRTSLRAAAEPQRSKAEKDE